MTTKKGYIGSGGINSFGNMATKIENNIRDVLKCYICLIVVNHYN